MSDLKQDLLVVSFFRTPNGELHCRVRDPFTKEHWIVVDPDRVADLLNRRAAPTSRAAKWFE